MALLTCEAALLAANPEILGPLEGARAHRASSARAAAVMVQVRKPSAALAPYRQAVTCNAAALDEEQVEHASR
jgi:hypothetical protein